MNKIVSRLKVEETDLARIGCVEGQESSFRGKRNFKSIDTKYDLVENQLPT